MSKITIEIPDEWKEDFIGWMCNCGEQDFMEIVEDKTRGQKTAVCRYPGYQTFPRHHNEIIITVE